MGYEKCRVELFEKRKDRALIMVSHQAEAIREHCERACVLSGGRLHSFARVDEAFAFYESSQG